MTDEELRVRAIQELEFYKKDDTFMLADITVDLAIKALEQEPCEDAISRGKLIKDLNFLYNEDGFVKDTRARRTLEVIMGQAPVTPQPKTGHWIWCIGSHKCSNCEEYTCFSHKELLKYCPNCGCRMVEPQERCDKDADKKCTYKETGCGSCKRQLDCPIEAERSGEK